MIWCEVSLTAPVELAPAIAEVMITVIPSGAQIDDPVIPLGPEEGYRIDHGRPSTVRAYIPVDDNAGQQVSRLRAALDAAGYSMPLTTRSVNEEDWAHAWKDYFHVERFGRHLVVRPSWREFTPEPGDVVIDLDPGMAFGTGQHPTTRMCLELLEMHVRAGDRVLDVGTGSGILSVAAAKLGAALCLAVDVESQAVQVTRENARRNGVEAAVMVDQGTLGDGWPAGLPAPDDVDVVVANITAAAVASLGADCARSLRSGGVIIGSGIVAERGDLVRDAWRAAGLSLLAEQESGDWLAVTARKP